jgi:TrmH family RNA methyltransferase
MWMQGKISIILVGTTHPGNVGATARAMRVMGLEHLLLVTPQCKIGEVARARASGALDVLDNARVVETLEEAIDEAHFVVGTSARERALGPVPQTLRAGMDECLQELGQGNVAILFGPERTGLDNATLERCNRLWHIPTAQDYASLNLAAAVQVLAYELFQALGASSQAQALPEAASAGEVTGLMAHFEAVARAVGFIAPDAPRQALHRSERLAHRLRLEPSEVKMLRGFLSAVERQQKPVE